MSMLWLVVDDYGMALIGCGHSITVPRQDEAAWWPPYSMHLPIMYIPYVYSLKFHLFTVWINIIIDNIGRKFTFEITVNYKKKFDQM